jgi:hypothetical protein
MPPLPVASPGPDVTTPSVGEVLSVSAEHLRGLHDTPRTECWRCRRTADAEPDVTGHAAGPPDDDH